MEMKTETKMGGRGVARESLSGFLRYRSILVSLAQESIPSLSPTQIFLGVHYTTAN